MTGFPLKKRPFAPLALERKKWVCDLTRLLVRITFWPRYTLLIRGTEYLPVKEAFVMLPKHQRWQDIPLIAVATPRPLYFVAKHELFQNTVIAKILKSQGGIPLNRENPLKSRSAIRAMIQFLKNGEGVVVFPEGTYFPERVGPGRGGILKLIISRLALPLIPVGVRYRKKSGKTLVTVSFGRPLYHPKHTSGDVTLDRVMAAIADLSGLKREEESKSCTI